MSAELRTAKTYTKLTKADGATFDAPRALWVGTAGTANITDMAGTVHTDFPLIAGFNPIRITQLRTGGTAGDIWALF